MRRDLLICVLFVMILLISLCIPGCLQEDNSKNNNSIEDKNKDIIVNQSLNAIRLTARELSSKINENLNDSNYTIYFETLNEKDKIIIVDTIDDIYYLNGNTSISFEFEKNKNGIEEYNFIFENNLTDEYKIGDKVEINLTLKHVIFNDTNYNFDLEIFEQQWENNEYFIEKFYYTNPYKALPRSIIKKSDMDAYVILENNSWNNSEILRTYDKNVSTYMTTLKNINNSNWTDWIVFENLRSAKCSKIRFLAYNNNNIDNPIMHCQIKINYDTNNQSAMIYDTTNGSSQWYDASDYSCYDWCEASFTPTTVDKVMIRFKAVNGSSVRPKLYEFELL